MLDFNILSLIVSQISAFIRTDLIVWARNPYGEYMYVHLEKTNNLRTKALKFKTYVLKFKTNVLKIRNILNSI